MGDAETQPVTVHVSLEIGGPMAVATLALSGCGHGSGNVFRVLGSLGPRSYYGVSSWRGSRTTVMRFRGTSSRIWR